MSGFSEPEVLKLKAGKKASIYIAGRIQIFLKVSSRFLFC